MDATRSFRIAGKAMRGKAHIHVVRLAPIDRKREPRTVNQGNEPIHIVIMGKRGGLAYPRKCQAPEKPVPALVRLLGYFPRLAFAIAPNTLNIIG